MPVDGVVYMPMDLSLTELYEKHAGELLRFATVVVGPGNAEDVTSAVWLGLFGMDWSDIRDPRSFLFRCVMNAGHDARRSADRRERRETWTMRSDVAEDLTVRPIVREALQRLSVRQRAAVYLRYWFDLETEEIARQLRLSRRTVERELRVARKLLEELLR